MSFKGSIYRSARKIADQRGYHVLITKKSQRSDSYEVVVPQATYAPWLGDRAFQETYNVAKTFTMNDKYRCFELWQLMEETAHLQGGIIEIGVWRGGTGAIIAKKAKLMNIKDTVYLCDTFTGVVKAGTKDSAYAGGEHSDTSKETVQGLLDRLGLDNVKLLTGIFPNETGKDVSDTSLRMCHVDVDVYQSASDIVDWAWPKLPIGGVIVFDDYGFLDTAGVTKYVNEQRGKTDRIVIHNLNGHGIIVKLT